jgi:glucose-6-phosphate 1-dehydrogenase
MRSLLPPQADDQGDDERVDSHTATEMDAPPRPGDPCAVVIFGASGDLTHRKLIPALHNLAEQGLLSRTFAVLGVSRSPMTDGEFRRGLVPKEDTAQDESSRKAWAWLSERIFYMPGDTTDSGAFGRLREKLQELDRTQGTRGNAIFYLSVAPQLFAATLHGLGEAGLLKEEGHRFRRVVIEKPFGHDLVSAQGLNDDLRQVVTERQTYRIDHYLGKETVQNLMVFRFGNAIFEPIWNRKYIDSVQITVAEELGVEGRGAYYDTAGAMRDMTPNHIAQLLSLVGMEPPISFSPDAVRDEQVKLLRSVQPMAPEDVLNFAVRGQYDDGHLGDEKVPAYRNELKVSPVSNTETYVAIRFLIDNWRWANVPFYARTGKRMPKRGTEIAIQFKPAPFMLFRKTSVSRLATNRLIIYIQPNEGIRLRFGAKVPGPILKVGHVNMDFDYTDYFGAKPSTGYETLLYDCMVGDQTLFQRSDMVEAGWRMVQPLLDVWKALPPRNFPNYHAGTCGPVEADQLLERDGRHWEKLEA